MRVTAYTTLDLVDATAEGHGFEETAPAVVDVSTPRASDEVTLQFELDNTRLADLPAHADTLHLTPAQARDLASALEAEARAVEDDAA